MNTISIRTITNYEYQEIKYNSIDILNEKIINIIDSKNERHIQLILNGIYLNKFNIIDNLRLSKYYKNDYITIIFIEKKDNYHIILEEIIKYYGNQSYDIIKKSSYKELVFSAITHNKKLLKYISYKLQKEFILKLIKQNENALIYADINVQNDKDFIMEIIKQNENTLLYRAQRFFVLV